MTKLKMLSDDLTFMDIVHFNAGKDRYPQVIAVSTTADRFVINAVVPAWRSLGSNYRRAVTASLQGSGLVRASRGLGSEGKIHPEIL